MDQPLAHDSNSTRDRLLHLLSYLESGLIERRRAVRLTLLAALACEDNDRMEMGLILICDRETVGVLELTDNILWVRDWRRFGASDADSPVHSKSLTAMYFPGALRSPENRRSTVAGDTASAAIRAGLHRGEHPPDQEQT